jgi:hypothetical protein
LHFALELRVVRTSALREFETFVSQQEQRPEKPIERRERTSLLVIIAALAKMAKIDVTKPSAAAIAIETQTELMGIRVASREGERDGAPGETFGNTT